MKRALKDYMLLIVLAVLLVFGLFTRQMMLGNLQSQQVDANNQLIQLENQRDTTVGIRDEQKQEVLNETSGLDLVRQAADDEVVKEMMGEIFTWENLEEYNQIKKFMVGKYKVDEKQVEALMPEVAVIPSQTENINEIDAYGLNMKFVDMTSYVVGITGTDYRYLTEVTVRSSDKAGNTADGKVLVGYSVDYNHNITDFKPHILANR